MQKQTKNKKKRKEKKKKEEEKREKKQKQKKTHRKRLCKTTEIFVTIENVFFYLIFILTHLVLGFLIFVYIYIYIKHKTMCPPGRHAFQSYIMSPSA